MSAANSYTNYSQCGGGSLRPGQYSSVSPVDKTAAVTPAPIGVPSETGRSDLARLKEIEHLAWHLLDDSEHRMNNGEIVVLKENFDALSKLLPEGHPMTSERDDKLLSESPLAWLVFCENDPSGFDYMVFASESEADTFACGRDMEASDIVPLYRRRSTE